MTTQTAPAPTPAAPGTASGTARERLLAAAGELFYAEGIHTVGIDRIIEQAGVAKASLYNTFGSKDELIRAYLRSRHERVAQRITTAIERQDSPRAKLLAVFDAQDEQLRTPTYRGCAFVNASAESLPGGPVEQPANVFRGWLRDTIVDLARAAGAGDPETLSRQLLLLYDGASISARMDGNVEAAALARSTADALLDSALPRRRRSTAK